MQEPVRKTSLHSWHVAHGANMAVFGGYEMPLWYPTGAKSEHLAVIKHAGAFDTSHMAVVTVQGPGGYALLQLCFTRDLERCVGKERRPLEPRRCVYGAFLNENGETIDDAIVYQLNPEFHMVVVNAGMGGKIAEHLRSYQTNSETAIEDLTDKVGKMDIQGPDSAKILRKMLLHPEQVFDDMTYFSFKGDFSGGSTAAGQVQLSDGTPVLLSRSGYTGEFGFELFIDPIHTVSTWEKLMDVGEEFGLTACGLAARDSLRTGAMLPLSHQDIGHWPYLHHPWSFALPFNELRTGFTKRFVGSDALLQNDRAEFTFAYVGNDLRKVSTEDPAVVLDREAKEIGTVLTCATDMAIGCHEGRIYSIASPDRPQGFNARGLSCGFVKVKTALNPGDVVELRDRRRNIKVTIVEDIRPDRTARRPIRQML